MGDTAREPHRSLHHLDRPADIDGRAHWARAHLEPGDAFEVSVHLGFDRFVPDALTMSTRTLIRYGSGGATTPCSTEPVSRPSPSSRNSCNQPHRPPNLSTRSIASQSWSTGTAKSCVPTYSMTGDATDSLMRTWTASGPRLVVCIWRWPWTDGLFYVERVVEPPSGSGATCSVLLEQLNAHQVSGKAPARQVRDSVPARGVGRVRRYVAGRSTMSPRAPR